MYKISAPVIIVPSMSHQTYCTHIILIYINSIPWLLPQMNLNYTGS